MLPNATIVARIAVGDELANADGTRLSFMNRYQENGNRTQSQPAGDQNAGTDIPRLRAESGDGR